MLVVVALHGQHTAAAHMQEAQLCFAQLYHTINHTTSLHLLNCQLLLRVFGERRSTVSMFLYQPAVVLQVLEHNEHLQQQLQELSNATPHASAPATPAAGPATTAMQVSLLCAALAEANYRLAAAGLLPVAATRLQEVSRSQVCAPWASAAPSACCVRHLRIHLRMV